MQNNNFKNMQQNYSNANDGSYIIAKFNADWIKKGATKEMIKFCEDCGEFLRKRGLTTSQIRNFYGEIKRIQMGDFELEKSSFYLLKAKIAYAVGRQKQPGGKPEGIEFFQKIFNKAYDAIENKNDFNNFCSLLEAIVAFHKANGGK